MALDALEYLNVVHEAHYQLTAGIHVEEVRWAMDALGEANPTHAMLPLLEAKIIQLVVEARRVPKPDRRELRVVASG